MGETSLLDLVRDFYVRQATKHGLMRKGESADDYADRQINDMTNVELVQAIDEALKERKA